MKASLAASWAAATASLVSAAVLPAPAPGAALRRNNNGDNDYTCRSGTHPNPVVMLHALGGNRIFDLSLLSGWLRLQGFCTFSLTYGNAPGSLIGGLDHINTSAPVIGAFIKQVAQRTGSKRVDLVGHSEGAFQALYVPKFVSGVAPLVDRIVSVAPATHGTSLSGLWTLVRLLGRRVEDQIEDVLKRFGCRACVDLVVGSALLKHLAEGPIVQPNTTVMVIASRKDVFVTPPESAFVLEKGVRNLFVQDVCPTDEVGHFGMAVAPNVWRLVRDALEGVTEGNFTCIGGIPLLDAGKLGGDAAEDEAAEITALDEVTDS
ncbi:hypothetical protein E4U57_003727 [Claviceps arundinis]|uniref:Lipase n=1 Tax=Claviceps arundinis TaxID=1623583 RepID=A0A9P7MP70_9HYPO|nr:hypothetical protein E4U56_003278 [Claviceps arundinis]KAG5965727.1 hypothetical protein E4U57_003727 [Claviceps arundinis]